MDFLSYLGRIPAEQGKKPEVISQPLVDEDNDNKDDIRVILLDMVLDRDNLNKVYKQIYSNKGAPGIDRMNVDDELKVYLRENREEVIQRLRDRKYKVRPVKRVQISKDTPGEFRNLVSPTAVERVI